MFLFIVKFWIVKHAYPQSRYIGTDKLFYFNKLRKYRKETHNLTAFVKTTNELDTNYITNRQIK